MRQEFYFFSAPENLNAFICRQKLRFCIHMLWDLTTVRRVLV
jgi:hypothetical protein